MASGVSPTGCIQTCSPVFMLIAVMRPYGGFTRGSPNTVIGGRLARAGVDAPAAAPDGAMAGEPGAPAAPRPASGAGPPNRPPPSPPPPPPPPPWMKFIFERDGSLTRLRRLGL